MRKTSIYLDDDLDRTLSLKAKSVGMTKAELIRQSLRAAAAEPRPRPRARGVFDGPADLARDADRHLGVTGFGKR